MTATEIARPGTEQADGSAPDHESAPAAPAPPPGRQAGAVPGPPRQGQTARTIGATLALVALVLLGFVAYLFGLSRLSEQHSQNVMYKSFAHALGQATAPIGPVERGTPVAILDIPALGIAHLVVVEGTDARSTTNGPGHRRDTVLPGQAGVSVIYGRRTTFGGPFSKLSRLAKGDVVYATTGQGVARYVVASFGHGAYPPAITSDNRIVLTTTDSSFVPHSTITVSADLKTAAQPSAGGTVAMASDERSMQGAPDRSMLPLMLWGLVLLITAVVGTVAVRRWSKWPAWLCFAPVALAVLWNVYENAATLLPNVY